MADASLRPAGIARHWASESRSLRASTAALAVGLLATLVAGAVLATARGILEDTPGLLVLIPAAIGMRGSIFGAMASRLGTGMLTGQFEASFARDSYLARQVDASIRLGVGGAVGAGVIAWGAARLFGIDAIPMLELIAISLVGAVIASAVLLVVTVGLAIWSRQAEWSIDDVGAPVITAVGDLVSLPALLLATIIVPSGAAATMVGAGSVLLGAVTVGVGAWSRSELVRRVVRESTTVLVISISIDIAAGTVMETRLESLLEQPALLVLIPPFVATCGALGGMLASRVASKLHVGLLEPHLRPSADGWLDLSMTLPLATMSFLAVGGVGWVAAAFSGVDPPALLGLVVTSLTGGLLATVALVAVAWVAANATFRFGLDPDNHGIPIVTASMDLLGILCLVAAIGLTQGALS